MCLSRKGWHVRPDPSMVLGDQPSKREMTRRPLAGITQLVCLFFNKVITNIYKNIKGMKFLLQKSTTNQQGRTERNVPKLIAPQLSQRPHRDKATPQLSPPHGVPEA